MPTTHTLFIYLVIGLGAAIGGMARYWCVGLTARLLGETFPWGTLAVNVMGSALLGFFATLSAPDGRLLVPTSTRLMISVGLFGGFTTFSSFSFETLALAMDREYLKAAGNVSANVATCLIGVWVGHALASAINQR